jgi:pimeloyl-ACP methyl ester carboxylesterase
LRCVAGAPELARESFFSQSIPDADVARWAAQLGEEYIGKMVLDLLLLDLPKPNLVTTPLLVLGAEDDIIFTQQEVRATAAAYHTEADFFPKMAHDMMLEPEWADVAELIDAWLETRCRA